MKLTFRPIRLTEVAEIYSIDINDEELSEFEKFVVLFKNEKDKYLESDFQSILTALDEVSKRGALARYFRNEGAYKDRVVALPVLIIRRNKKTNGTLRLYCLRISDKLLIIGGGGLKTTDKYEETAELKRIVKTLQDLDKELVEAEEFGVVLENTINNLVIYIPEE